MGHTGVDLAINWCHQRRVHRGICRKKPSIGDLIYNVKFNRGVFILEASA
jgi:hypothetical protein